MKIAALILAAGRGTRVGGDIPKQWQLLKGKPVLFHSFSAMANKADIVAVVLHPDDQDLWDASGIPADLTVDGGATRDASVRAGLEALKKVAPDLVLIHDAARPVTPQPVIDRVITALQSAKGAAPALQDRTGLYRAQTPQGFHFSEILDAHQARLSPAADDVEVARDAGMDVTIVTGDEANLKITTPEDFARAEQLMEPQMDVRLGNGFDVHRFGDGDHVWLCGVKVPHNRSLQGHSDADVGMHAITDAIYGALGMGDIGVHFPPSDPQWKGAESQIFLRHAVSLVRKMGFSISNVDCTLICELPKIGPHQEAMKAALSDIMTLSADRISVKATTSEKLGFTGRGEGIASIATATLIKS